MPLPKFSFHNHVGEKRPEFVSSSASCSTGSHVEIFSALSRLFEEAAVVFDERLAFGADTCARLVGTVVNCHLENIASRISMTLNPKQEKQGGANCCVKVFRSSPLFPRPALPLPSLTRHHEVIYRGHTLGRIPRLFREIQLQDHSLYGRS